jgi:phage terminase large subunit-like protein
MIFSNDENDNINIDENCWYKSNPNIGKSIRLEYLRDQIINMNNNVDSIAGIKTKNFNQWM